MTRVSNFVSALKCAAQKYPGSFAGRSRAPAQSAAAHKQNCKSGAAADPHQQFPRAADI